MDNFEALSFPLLLGFVVACFFSTVLLLYITNGTDSPIQTEKEHIQQPPLLPYAVPLMGHLPLSFIWDPLNFSHTYVAEYHR
jgi:hypothetical protein